MANLVDHVGLKIAVDPHPNLGALVDLVGEEVQARSVKVSAKLKKLLKNSVATRSDCADLVVNKLYKAGKAEPDPLRGLDETAEEGKPVVVAYEVDPDLRETERLARLKDGRI